MIVAALSLSMLAASPDPEPPRAELCLAHVEAMIAEAQRETGMVAGPSWFIRSWWTARLPEDDAPEAWSAEQRARLGLSMADRKAAGDWEDDGASPPSANSPRPIAYHPLPIKGACHEGHSAPSIRPASTRPICG